MIVTRFAPSPTGRLHIGNIRTALLNWLLARQGGGRFLLRMDDTDAARSTAAFADGIRADLHWLGMTPDAEVRQSDRIAAYDAALARLAASGHAYRAYETPEELEIRRKLALSRGAPPVYDRAALALTEADHARFAAEGVAPHWRFRRSGDAPRAWNDLVRGPSHITPDSLSDPVIRRADGGWLYMLPSVIDDIDMGVTHVVRGEDHVTNTGIQLQMFAALGAPAPAFGHAALLTGTDGALSKRLGSLGVDHLRERGIEPAAIKALLARLGTSLPVEPVADDATLIAGFAIGNLGRATARFDEAELAQVNARIVHQMPFDAVGDRLPAGLAAAEWAAIRPNLETVGDAAAWHAVVTGPIAPPALPDEDRAYLATAATTLEALPFDAGVWPALTEALKAATTRKGKPLFLPLRRALTGMDHGPDMTVLLPLIGRDAALARLRAAG